MITLHLESHLEKSKPGAMVAVTPNRWLQPPKLHQDTMECSTLGHIPALKITSVRLVSVTRHGSGHTGNEKTTIKPKALKS